MWQAPAGGGNPVVEHQLARLSKEVQDINLRLLAIVEMVRQMNADHYAAIEQHEGNRPI